MNSFPLLSNDEWVVETKLGIASKSKKYEHEQPHGCKSSLGQTIRAEILKMYDCASMAACLRLSALPALISQEKQTMNITPSRMGIEQFRTLFNSIEIYESLIPMAQVDHLLRFSG